MVIKSSRKRTAVIFGIFLCFTALVFYASLLVGKYKIAPGEVTGLFRGRKMDDMAARVFFTLRFPRTVMAFLAGAGLSVAGSIYQNIFHNPLASPDLIGVSSGANAGAAFAIVCLHGGAALAAGSAFAGGLLAVSLAVFLAGAAKRRSAADFVLAGVAVKALSDAFIMTMKYLADPERQLASIDYWSMGSFAGMTADKLRVAGPLVIFAFMGLILMRWRINLLTLSDDEAQMLGVAVHINRIIVLGLTTLMVAASISVTGSISFIGLIAPHIARMIFGKSDFTAAVGSGLIGGFIILTADIGARSFSASEIPVSIFTSLIGVPILIWLLGRKEA